jgi:glycosyltransferase involved in cell wall biosynthesis
LVERSIAQVDAMLAPSEYTARRHRGRGFKPPIHVLQSFSAIEQQLEYRPRHDRPRFLFVGRLTASKGIVQLLEEFAGLPAYDLQVVGDGELHSKLEERFACCSNIRFVGPKPQVELVPLYQDATALILPSLVPETFALSIIEAFACRTPAIVHDAGGAGEPIEATGGGIIYRTSEELRLALSRVAYEPGLRETLAGRARDGFLRLYTRQRHLKNYLALVESIQLAKGLS